MRAGRFGEALVLSTQCGPDYTIVPLLMRALPGWPAAQNAVEDAFHELTALQKLRVRARALGVSRGVLDPLDRETEVVSSVLGRLADRLGVAGAPPWESCGIQTSVVRMLERIDRITAALRAARTGLTELTLGDDGSPGLSPGDETARVRLLALAETARELASMADQRVGSPPEFRS